MKVIIEKKNNHMDYVDVARSERLIANASKDCEQRDLPCGQKNR